YGKCTAAFSRPSPMLPAWDGELLDRWVMQAAIDLLFVVLQSLRKTNVGLALLVQWHCCVAWLHANISLLFDYRGPDNNLYRPPIRTFSAFRPATFSGDAQRPASRRQSNHFPSKTPAHALYSSWLRARPAASRPLGL